MKQEVLQSLLTAKVLFSKAQDLCYVEDKYTASSGLIILQDALELIFLASLVEIGTDEKKSMEKYSFDQLIGELKSERINVIKSGTLKALNKQRVIIKHYGQVSEPQTVGTYFEVAQQAANSVLEQVVGKSLNQIVLCELINNEETRKYLEDACEALENNKFLKCLTSIRKAIYIEIEKDYCIYEWKDSEPNESFNIFNMARGGRKAPYYTRNKEWIEKNVTNPFEYIQRDHSQIRNDLLEWGASTQDFWNLWRLTPEVMQLNKDGKWFHKGELKHLYQAATIEDATFCLDRAVTLLSKKQAHNDMARWLDHSPTDQLRVRIKEQAVLYKKASDQSEALIQLEINSIYDANSVVSGLSGNDRYVSILHFQEAEPRYMAGYVDLESCEAIEPEKD